MTDLIACIKYIRDGLAALPAIAEGINDEAGREARRKAIEELVTRIEKDLPKVRITERYDGAKVSIAGVKTSCTGGLHGGLTNWIAAARRHLDNEGFIKTTAEKENVR